MIKFTNYGLLLLAIFLAGSFAQEGSWLGSAIMCIAAGVAFFNIKTQRRIDAAELSSGAQGREQ